MSWHKISLSVDQVVNGEEMKVQQQFNILFMAARGPRGMALFSTKLESEGVEMFFSPGSLPLAKPLIESYLGTPCEKPDRNAVALLLGHADAKDTLL